ncbi:[NiFe]-hydrogenase assembly chaperone HybE [Thiohalorhabdus methylotrophus]|uniref:[NiFe]-hydrogenase assembly chaperone HybE n=1 Tax=Thiohalorhabdus methylotrophus TaxID=3242694 RepID=A0ABV4TTV7_9GAMM
MSQDEPRWEFHAVPDPVAGLEAAYQGIQFEMLGYGSPRLNECLEVRAEGPETRDGWHQVLLVTPWAAMQVYLPREPHDLSALPEPAELECEEDGRVVVGAELRFPFDGVIHDLEVAYDTRLGHHLVEMLLTSMGAFQDTEEALVWARERAARRNGRQTPSDAESSPGPRRVSRRDLFRGLLGRR